MQPHRDAFLQMLGDPACKEIPSREAFQKIQLKKALVEALKRFIIQLSRVCHQDIVSIFEEGVRAKEWGCGFENEDDVLMTVLRDPQDDEKNILVEDLQALEADCGGPLPDMMDLDLSCET
eukprot:scaffold1614_cov173-Pinguiococcus_pyrenoidosus.AAC.3